MTSLRALSFQEAAAAFDGHCERWNTTVAERGLGGRIVQKTPETFTLKELWPGAGMATLKALPPDSWEGRFIIHIMEVMRDGVYPLPASPPV